MALNATEITVAANGSIYVAPVGTTLPAKHTDPTAGLNAAFGYALGYASEDGVTFSATPDVTDIGAWQSKDPVRRLVTATENSVSTELMQWNEKTFPLVFGGGEVTEAGGFYTYTPPAADEGLAEVSVIIDWNDGDKNYRLVIPRANATEGTETQLQRGASANLALTLKALAPAAGVDVWYLNTDDPAFAVGS